MTINLVDWLTEVQDPGTDQPNAQASAGGPIDPSIANPADQMGAPAQQQPAPGAQPGQQPDDVSGDPQLPDIPDDQLVDDKDFESWKKEFLTEAIKGDVEKMKDLIMQVRDRDLDPYQRKFVEDNLQILFLREHSNIDKASKEIRKLVKEQLDHNNPATSLVNHMATVLQEQPLLTNVYIKLSGLLSMKGDCHRKFVAALTGSVQVGSGARTEDLIFNEKEYSIRISTRFNARFGDVHLGEWSLHQDDPQRYLQPPEMKRLQEGSPEERDVLRRRVVMESIAEAFKTRSFIINVVGTDGTVYTIGWDLASSLRSAYTDGKLVVRTKNEKGEAMIDEDGNIVPLVDMKVMYMQNTGDTDEEGKPERNEVEFIHLRHGQLFLTAQLPVFKEAGLQGFVLKETPWTGNPTDLKTLARCVPSLPEIIMRQC